MRWTDSIRNIASGLLLFSGILSIYIGMFTIYMFRNSILFFRFRLLDWIDIWVPLIGSLLGITFSILGFVMIRKREHWLLAIIGAAFGLVTPIVWQLWPATTRPEVNVVRLVAIIVGILTVTLLLLSRKDFKSTRGLP